MANAFQPYASVSSYIGRARVLLQDTVDAPYRYSDFDLIAALNFGLSEMRRLRPDLFLNVPPQRFDNSSPDTDLVIVDDGYRIALVYYVCGHAQMRDDENTQDQRAVAFFSLFNSKLTAVA